MKILQNTFALLLVALLTFSCSNNDDGPSPAQNQPQAPQYFFKAKIDGVQYTADGVIKVMSSASSTDIKINNINTDNRNFEIKLDRSTGLGTYIYPAPATADYVLRLSYGDASSATAIWRTGTCTGTTSGTLTITALSATEISGTFSFTGKRTSFCSDPAKQITEGSFKSQIIQ